MCWPELRPDCSGDLTALAGPERNGDLTGLDLRAAVDISPPCGAVRCGLAGGCGATGGQSGEHVLLHSPAGRGRCWGGAGAARGTSYQAIEVASLEPVSFNLAQVQHISIMRLIRGTHQRAFSIANPCQQMLFSIFPFVPPVAPGLATAARLPVVTSMFPRV